MSESESGLLQEKRTYSVVERALDLFVDSFVVSPYLHRREHSLHCTLYEILLGQPELNGFWPIGDTGQKTRLVHKEWPWAKPEKEGGRRGNHDLAVLSKKSLAEAADLKQFTEGTIKPEIAIEIGLNYALDHLEKDRNTLLRLREEKTSGFLVHLEQPHIQHEDSTYEKLICSIEGCELPSVAVIYRKGSPLIKHIKDKGLH